jgi:hypothetical protein
MSLVLVYILQLIKDLWSSGVFVAILLNIRFVFESWGAIHFALGVANSIIHNVNVEQAIERAARLTFGARSEVRGRVGWLIRNPSTSWTLFAV